MSRRSLTLLDSRQWVEVHEQKGSFRAELHSPFREASLGVVTRISTAERRTVEEALRAVLGDTSFIREVPEIAGRISRRWR